MSWDLILDDSFTHADTSAGSAASDTGVPTTPATGAANGWEDLTGGIYSIASDQLSCTASNNNYGVNVLFRTVEAGNPDVRILADVPAGTLLNVCLILRYSSGDFYLVQATTTGWDVYAVVGGSASGLSGQTGTWSPNTADAFEFDFSASGSSPTTVALTITDTTTSTVLVTTSTTDSTSALQSTGLSFGFDQFSGGSQTQLYSRVRGYNLLSGSPPTVGAVTFTTATTTAITMTAASVTAGATVQWYRATTSGFTPGGGNILSGATSLTLVDSTAVAGVDYFYQIIGTNGYGSTTGNQAYGALPAAALAFSALGDSTYLAYNDVNDSSYHEVDSVPEVIGRLVGGWGGYDAVTVDNDAHGGYSTASYYTSGAPTAALTGAVANAVANGSQYVHITLGINDADNGHSSSTYGTNLAGICDTYLASGITPIVHYPYFQPTDSTTSAYWTNAVQATMMSYYPVIDSLISGSSGAILAGDKRFYNQPALHVSLYFSNDHQHLNVQGNGLQGAFQAFAFWRILYLSSTIFFAGIAPAYAGSIATTAVPAAVSLVAAGNPLAFGASLLAAAAPASSSLVAGGIGSTFGGSIVTTAVPVSSSLVAGGIALGFGSSLLTPASAGASSLIAGGFTPAYGSAIATTATPANSSLIAGGLAIADGGSLLTPASAGAASLVAGGFTPAWGAALAATATPAASSLVAGGVATAAGGVLLTPAAAGAASLVAGGFTPAWGSTSIAAAAPPSTSLVASGRATAAGGSAATTAVPASVTVAAACFTWASGASLVTFPPQPTPLPAVDPHRSTIAFAGPDAARGTISIAAGSSDAVDAYRSTIAALQAQGDGPDPYRSTISIAAAFGTGDILLDSTGGFYLLIDTTGGFKVVING